MLRAIVIALLLFFPSCAQAFTTYKVQEDIPARFFNDLLQNWQSANLTVWVGLNGDVATLIFEGEVSYKPATVHIKYDKIVQRRLEAIVNQSIEWASVAKSNKADTNQGLGCFGSDAYGLCNENSRTYDENQIAFRFFSRNAGAQTDLIVDITDRGNEYITGQLYLDVATVLRLKKTLTKVPEKLSFARAEKDKSSDLFKKSDELLTANNSHQDANKITGTLQNLADVEKARSEKPKLDFFEVELLKKELGKCWQPPAGTRAMKGLSVDLLLDFDKSGAVTKVTVLNKVRYEIDAAFRAAANAATRAVVECQPVDIPLYGGDYDKWTQVKVTFDTKHN